VDVEIRCSDGRIVLACVQGKRGAERQRMSSVLTHMKYRRW
jgi:hypothetical protein